MTTMNTNKIWPVIKHRYRLSSKAQMSFEMGFPEFLIGQCRFTAGIDTEVRTKKVTLAMKGIVLSDTIPLSWFTSSVFIPWDKTLEIGYSDDFERCTFRLDDPGDLIIDLPWSKAFTDYAHRP